MHKRKSRKRSRKLGRSRKRSRNLARSRNSRRNSKVRRSKKSDGGIGFAANAIRRRALAEAASKVGAPATPVVKSLQTAVGQGLQAVQKGVANAVRRGTSREHAPISIPAGLTLIAASDKRPSVQKEKKTSQRQSPLKSS